MKHKSIPFKIGHVLIQVDDLEKAIHQYHQMGFQVMPGGLPGKTHNALIHLKDGAFLELFSTNHGKIVNALLNVMVKVIGLSNQSYSSRLARYLPGHEGLRDYALDSVPVTQYLKNLEKIQENEVKVAKPRPKSRTDHRGIRLQWTLSLPESIALPFLMSEYQPPMKIEEKDVAHPNGALGIEELQIATSQWETVYGEYALLLGIEPDITGKKMDRSCRFSIQGTSILLMEKKSNGLERVVLSCDSQSQTTDTHTSLPPFILLQR